MKLPENNISTESSGMILEESFGVGNVGLIFEILRNKMYKNPILAIAREITCNARDAHREVGKAAIPIEIHLPNAFAPQYKVKDYGPGISPERMSKVFIQYATSTKRGDNSQTGGFGLGAKTPFSYADTFSILTVVDGVKRTYNAYIDETSVGKMALASEQKTDESNGTTIIIPVAKKDFQEFINTTMSVTEYWDVRPILNGVNPSPLYQDFKILYTGNNWALYTRKTSYSYNSYQSNSIAIIDGIGYPIEISSISNISEFYKNLLTNPFHFYFGNGELSLSASRDSIHYDEKTQKVLIQRISALSKEVIEIINKKIENCASYKEACFLYKQTLQEFNNPSQLQSGLRTAKLWKGFRLILDPSPTDIGKWAKLTSYHRKMSKIRSYWGSHIDYNGKLFHNEKEDVPKKLVDYYFSINPNLQILQVVSTPKEPEAVEYQNLVKQNKAAPVEYDLALLKEMGAEPITSIVVPKIIKPRKPRVKNKTTLTAYKLSCYQNSLSCKVAEIKDEGGVYIEVDYKERKYTSILPPTEIPYAPKVLNINSSIKINLIQEFLAKPLYGFTEKRALKLKDDWEPLQSAIFNRIKELESEITIEKIVESCQASNWLFQYIYEDIFQIRKLLGEIKSKDSLLLELIQESQRVEDEINKYRPFIYVLQLMKNIEGPVYDKYRRNNTPNNTKLCKLQQKVSERYPLLSMLGDRYEEKELRHMVSYVNLVDESHAAQCKITQLRQTA